ncbi:glycosyltransferase family A protein [Dactylosporangium sp. NPDC051485]|uniref:glycosyltransferase family 2 protein n=1 Tax=Dactylosporangium sp. NPDC051485 TaxID=3154846 RepID=UPI003437EB97
MTAITEARTFGDHGGTRPPEASIVVPVRARRRQLGRLLASIAAQDLAAGRVEVVVVDNPTRSNQRWLEAAGLPFPVRYAGLPVANRGLSRNVGAALARGRTLLFADSDVEFTPGAVAALLNASRMRPGTIVMADVVFPPGAPRSLGTHLLDVAAYFRAFRRQRRLGPLGFRHFVSCGFAISREAFERIGGFDAEFPRYGYEDVEFAVRAAGAGVEFALADVKAYHLKVLSPAAVLRQSVELGRSAVSFVRLHPAIEDTMPVGVAATTTGELWFPSDVDVAGLLRHARRLESRWSAARRPRYPLLALRDLVAEAREAYRQITLYGRFTGIREELSCGTEVA